MTVALATRECLAPRKKGIFRAGEAYACGVETGSGQIGDRLSSMTALFLLLHRTSLGGRCRSGGPKKEEGEGRRLPQKVNDLGTAWHIGMGRNPERKSLREERGLRASSTSSGGVFEKRVECLADCTLVQRGAGKLETASRETSEGSRRRSEGKQSQTGERHLGTSQAGSGRLCQGESDKKVEECCHRIPSGNTCQT